MSGLSDAERDEILRAGFRATSVVDQQWDAIGRIVDARVAAAEQRITEAVEAAVRPTKARFYDSATDTWNNWWREDAVRAALARPTEEATPGGAS